MLTFQISIGRFADYLALARYHYCAGRPATVHSVYSATARQDSPTLLWRTGAYPSLAGVLVVSYPPLYSDSRDVATGSRYRMPDRRAGFTRLNAEVLTISRVVVHPLYRSLGLAADLVRCALSRLDAPVVEAFARMGRYVPFFEQAGMRRVELPGKPAYFIAEK